jgi:RNA polymerase sigma-70 factor (ECF subfamily)
VIVLCDIEGLSYQEISQVLACPIGTVRSRIFHARRQLREQLKVYARQFGMEDIHEAV